MSMGLLVKSDQPLIWRGPMAHRALQQCLFDVDWGDLDYLIVDLPPGTGDVHLTLAQQVPLTGAVIVSTPQDVGSADFDEDAAHVPADSRPDSRHRREHELLHLPALQFAGSHLRRRRRQAAAAELEIPFLGEVPLDLAIRQQSDVGSPIVVAQPNSESAKTLREISRKVAAQVSIRALCDVAGSRGGVRHGYRMPPLQRRSRSSARARFRFSGPTATRRVIWPRCFAVCVRALPARMR